MLHRNVLHAYQENAISFIKEKGSCALWMDLGLGKTITTLTALSDLFENFDIGSVLIIAPLRVVKSTWPDEIKRWSHTQHLTYEVITGSEKERLKKLEIPADIHLINRELVPWLVEHALWKKPWPYDTVIIDEISSFKSSQTQRFKALKKVHPSIRRCVGLTGTPASNGLLDLWSQTYLLDRGERLEKTFSKFRTTYFTSDYKGYTWSAREGAEARITEKLQDLCLTLSAKDYLSLPPVIHRTIEIKLSKNTEKAYKTLEKEFLLALQDEKTIEVFHAAALTNKLLQFANGAVYHDDQKNWAEVHTEKCDALEEIVEESQGQPILVAYSFQSDLARLQKRFPKAKTLDQNSGTIKDWNSGKIPMLLAHPQSAGHGLNLQNGGNILVWFGLSWSLELYQQFNARLHRQGQTKPVMICHLIAKNTVDETVMNALVNKNITQKNLLEALKSDVLKRGKR